MSHESDQLSDLISFILDKLESDNEHIWFFDDANYKNALARYLYFTSVSKPSSLYPLLRLIKESVFTDADYLVHKTYLRYKQEYKKQTKLQKLKQLMLPWVALVVDIFTFLKNKKIVQKKRSNNESISIAFFIIHERFFIFFNDIDNYFRDITKRYFVSDSAISNNYTNADKTIIVNNKVGWRFLRALFCFKRPLNPIFLRLIFFFCRINEQLKCYKPNALLFAEGTSFYEELACQSAKLLNIPTIRLQSGRAGLLHSGYRNMAFDHMLCWGKGFAERYKSVSPSPHYHITGTSIMDHIASNVRRKVQPNEAFVVGIVTQPVSTKISNEDYQLLVELVTDLILKEIDLKVVIRLHPVDNSTLLLRLAEKHPEKVVLMNGPDYSLAQLFNTTDCIVSFFSTVISESIAAGVIPVLLQFRPEQSVFPFPEKFGAAVTVNSIEQCRLTLNNLRDNPSDYQHVRQNMRSFTREFFYKVDGEALNRQCLLIQQLIERDKLTD